MALQLIEHRRPGAPMRPVNLKLPAESIEALQQQAERIGCYPSALARALVMRGLAELTGAKS